MAGEKGEAQGEEQGGKSTDDLVLDSVFGTPSEEPPTKPDEEPSAEGTSGDEGNKGSKDAEDTKTEEEIAAEEAAAKETYEKLSPEEKTAADKVVADKETADLKEAYDKLTPEERKAADDKTAEEAAAAAAEEKAVTTRQIDDQGEALFKSEKRRQDTERWAQGLNQEMLQQKREILILQRQAKDPDYDPEKDESLREVGPTEEEKAAQEQRKGRAGASLLSAYEKYGKEKVQKELGEYKTLFAEDVRMQEQVLDAAQPVEEALSVLRLHKFFAEYGQDPEAIVQKIETTLRGSLTPKIREEESKRIMVDLRKTSKIPKGLSGVKGADETDSNKKGVEADDGSLEKQFG